METEIHFTQIRQVVLAELAKARNSIVIAAAVFNETELFNAICRQAAKGRHVRLAVIGNDINLGPGELNFDKLRDLGGEVKLLPSVQRNGEAGRSLHQKFCVIDDRTVLSGSFNWTRVRGKAESLQVIREAPEFAASYLEQFEVILATCLGNDASPPDINKVIKRVQALLTLLELEDFEAAIGQIKNFDCLTPYFPKLTPAINAVRCGKMKDAIPRLHGFLDRASAIDIWYDPALEWLRLELLSLESEIASLDARRTEAEMLLGDFARREHLRLGDLIARQLDLRRQYTACLLKRKAQGLDKESLYDEEDLRDQEAQHQQEQADYEKASSEMDSQTAPPELPADAEAEIKKIYRATVQLCHPDKVPDASKAKAEAVFKELSLAYSSKDLSKLREISARLKHGLLNLDSQATLPRDRVILETKLATLRRRRDAISSALNSLFSSQAWLLLQEAGDDWEAFFTKRRTHLAAEVDELSRDLSELEKDL